MFEVRSGLFNIAKRASKLCLIPPSEDAFHYALRMLYSADKSFHIDEEEWLNKDVLHFSADFINLKHMYRMGNTVEEDQFIPVIPQITLQYEKPLVETYFEKCRFFWKYLGYSDEEADSRAFWWDCIERWNSEGSWTDEKTDFVEKNGHIKPPDCYREEE